MKLEITALGTQGDGIAHDPEGKSYFVPGAVTGDKIILDAAGSVAEIIPGPNRQPPPCHHFGTCGGCQMQHLAPDVYRNWITSRILAALTPLGISPEEIAQPHLSPPGARRRVSVKLSHTENGLALGFNAERSHAVIDLAQCPVMHPMLWDSLQRLKTQAKSLLQQGQAWMVQSTLTDTGVDLSIHGLHQSLFQQMRKFAALGDGLDVARLAIDGPVGLEIVSLKRMPVVRFAGVAVMLPPNSFLQATEDGEQALRAAVTHAVGTSRKIADLFCGVGTFALPLAASASLLAVDAAKPAGDALARAAGDANLLVTVLHQDLFRRPLRAEELNRFDAIVFDPPRAGAKEQVAEIARSKVKCVVAVSCNPNTFARDAEQLVRAGYRLKTLTPVGQFLWSTHVELVAHFVK